MLSYVLAIIIFAGLGAIAVFGYRTSMEMADKFDSARRAHPTPAAPAVTVADTAVPS